MKQILYCLLFLSSFLSSAFVFADNQKKTVKYFYEDNKQLVDLVEDAAALVEEKGQAAFNELSDRSCPLHVLDSYIQVTDTEGNVVVDPLFPKLMKKRNVSHRYDLMGRNVFMEVKESFADNESTWIFCIKASGATSCSIAYMAGGLFILLGFFPKFSGLLSVMPSPVMGAILIYVTSFMIVSGIQIILGSAMDTRKTFVICIPLIFGLSLDILPSMFAQGPYFLRPLFDSSLTLSTVLAVILHHIFRLGIKDGPRSD